jgi:CRISPR-associated endonuclease/helicase Cas3
VTPELCASDFAAFFAAVNPAADPDEERRPFPWQEELVDLVWSTGRWPDLIDLPTGAGKTAAIDIAVFLMALRNDMPRRVVFVIDRRVVVHQAAERAARLSEFLRDGDREIVRAVAGKLRLLAAPPSDLSARTPELDTSPLQWAEMRGGMVRDESWAMRPDVPAVLVSTVDQVGSRLLFRGYGVSRSMRPVHAGLLGSDVLFLLDEVHLARPFSETLAMVADRYRPPGDCGLPDRWQVAELSATPGRSPAGRSLFTLGDRDRDPAVTPVLARRVSADKMVQKRLVRSRGKGSDAHLSAIAQEAADAARSAIAHGRSTAVGVVVNRVGTARHVHDLLGAATEFDRFLVTGRMRPFDRDDLLSDLTPRIRTGRTRSSAGHPLVVVATQALEVGADYDFDALVTECASLDALRQRFGRVDRDGLLSAQSTPSESVILAAAQQVGDSADDPIYGRALPRTWSWLPDARFSVRDLQPSPDILAELVAAKPEAPVLLPSHLDRWVQTSPYPDADPDVGLWLHGLDSEPSVDVNVIWRADLTETTLTADDTQIPVSLVTACRPGSGEAMPVPIRAVRAWLARPRGDQTGGLASPQVADVEGTSTGADDNRSDSILIKPVLRWLGDDSEVATSAQQIRPGDTLILPAAYGGISNGNWDPDSPAEVDDLGHRVQAEQRLRAVLRLEPKALGPDAERLPAVPLPAHVDADDEQADDTAVAEWLEAAVQAPGISDLNRRLIGELLRDNYRTVIRVRAGDYDDPASSFFVVSSRRRLPDLARRREPAGETVDSEPDTSSFTGTPTPLEVHLDDAERWARRLAAACGLSADLIQDLALAARLHDVGKADPRFQVMLHQGRWTAGDLLAKSRLPASERAARERARREAGYPGRGRHELLSVAMVQDNPDFAARAHDWELVLHLVASHHGYCRPFAPAVHDPHPVDAEFCLDGVQLTHSTLTDLARIDAGVADRFWRLVRRYGWYGLAWLECILRLADHRASEEAEQAQKEPAERTEVRV